MCYAVLRIPYEIYVSNWQSNNDNQFDLMDLWMEVVMKLYYWTQQSTQIKCNYPYVHA